MKIFRKIFERVYLKVLGTQSLSKVNDLILKLALRVRGYNNFRTLEESGERYFIDTVLKSLSPQLCVDVGANVGDFSLELLKSTHTEVIAFEPLSACQKQLEIIQSGYPDRLKVVKSAVGNTIGKQTIHFEADATAHASLSEEVKQVEYVKNTSSEEIDVTTLDHFFASQPNLQIDFLKIDTEGFELEVLQGFQRGIHQNPPKIIQIEYNWHQLFRNQSLFTLSKLLPDFELYQLCRGHIVHRKSTDPLSNIHLFSNFLFVRPDIVARHPAFTKSPERN